MQLCRGVDAEAPSGSNTFGLNALYTRPRSYRSCYLILTGAKRAVTATSDRSVLPRVLLREYKSFFRSFTKLTPPSSPSPATLYRLPSYRSEIILRSPLFFFFLGACLVLSSVRLSLSHFSFLSFLLFLLRPCRKFVQQVRNRYLSRRGKRF